MALPQGTYRLGPDDGTLTVRTGRTGAAAKAGHDLLFHVRTWEAVLAVGADAARSSVTLSADSGALQVVEGTGGIQALGDDDRASILQTIGEDVLRGQRIEFRSTSVEPVDGGLRVEGELTLVGQTRPLTFDVALADGALSGSAVIRQTSWGIKPYSTLFGALKVADEVRVELEARLPQSD